MSIRCQSWVYENSEATGNERLILLAIADEADDDGTNGHPGIDRIAHKARVNKRTTMRCIERLELAGRLVVHRPEVKGRGRYNTYVVVMTEGQKGDTLTESEKVRNGDIRARNGASPYLDRSRPVDPLTPEPKEPSPVEQVFQAWLTSTKKTARTVLDSKRRSLIERALKTHPPADVLDAVRGWEHSPYHRGENPEHKVWNDLGLLLRDAGKIEQFRDLARGPRLEGRPGGPARGNLPYRPPLIDTDRSGPSRVLTEDDL